MHKAVASGKEGWKTYGCSKEKAEPALLRAQKSWWLGGMQQVATLDCAAFCSTWHIHERVNDNSQLPLIS